ncbi:MAG: deoxyribose-phosphate aldolase [Planctomycetales bacterium]|nr:deoxyribose-phosphate aldolase [Planctomycetales bacterium]
MPQVTSIVALIDHAVLHPTQTCADVRAACGLCDRLGVASICVKPSHVPLAAELLAGSAVKVSTVIGFPHGGTSTAAKAHETTLACQSGAVEVDMVVNLGQALAGDWEYVAADIAAVVEAARAGGALTKVILETGLLPDDAAKRRLCELSCQAGAAFVKTSTGFGYVKNDAGALVSTGATEHDIRLMRAACPSTVGVKASGGIRSYEDAAKFVELGATRLGTSGAKAIAAGEPNTGDY